MKEWTVRVIDRQAEKNKDSFFEIANNLWVFAESKKEARKRIHKRLTEQGLIYGRDFVLGCVGPYTGEGKTVGFVGDTFKNGLPHHTLVAYKKVQIDDKKNNIKFEKYEKEFLMKKRVEDLNAPKYICSNGEFITRD